MATKKPAKKKASPTQVAARKLFAQRAKAGTLGRAPAKRVKNPVTKKTHYTRVLKGYALYFTDQQPGKPSAWFENSTMGRVAAQALADHYGGSVGLSPMAIEIPDPTHVNRRA